MGLSESKPDRLTTDERENRETAKQEMVRKKKAEIDAVQQSIMVTERSIIPHSDIMALVKVTETAKKQLDRNGDALTKTDLVAIVVALQPESRGNIKELEALRVSDLNTMIRTIIYDPSRIMKQNIQSTQGITRDTQSAQSTQSITREKGLQSPVLHKPSPLQLAWS
jgi:hypothetical protein